MWKHIHWLGFNNFIMITHKLHISGLCGRVTADVDDAIRLQLIECFDDILMHAHSRRIRDNQVRTSVYLNKRAAEHIFHVSCIKFGVVNLIKFRVEMRIFNSLRNRFYTYDLTTIFGKKVGDSSRT